MEATSSVPELVTAAQESAKASLARIEGHAGNAEELHAAVSELELTAVDIFSAFEARMQHHFKRGPFSRKLKAKLLDAGEGDLADRLHQHYLAINVLKHGTGASYRELLAHKQPLFILKPTSAPEELDAQNTTGLIDVTAAGFFEGLSATILDAYNFLENK
ncbi:MAG: hypothetical protein WBC85_12390 [Planktotalea sp.]|uniref:hypothetical protein n=1 Tax=Planktotalea sp. TaxID=2029877 RepID=UPI003C733E86